MMFSSCYVLGPLLLTINWNNLLVVVYLSHTFHGWQKNVIALCAGNVKGVEQSNGSSDASYSHERTAALSPRSTDDTLPVIHHVSTHPHIIATTYSTHLHILSTQHAGATTFWKLDSTAFIKFSFHFLCFLCSSILFPLFFFLNFFSI